MKTGRHAWKRYTVPAREPIWWRMSSRLVTRTRAVRARASVPVPRGFTIPELVVALAIIGVTTAFALHGLRQVVDGVAVRGAAAEVRAAFATARALAVRRAERAAVRLDTVAGAVSVHVRTDTALRRPLGILYRVRLAITRDSAAYGATGVGYGGSNLRVVVRRGAAAETVVVSRLGRVR